MYSHVNVPLPWADEGLMDCRYCTPGDYQISKKILAMSLTCVFARIQECEHVRLKHAKYSIDLNFPAAYIDREL